MIIAYLILVKTNERGTRESDHHSPAIQFYRSLRHVCHIGVWIIQHHLVRAERRPAIRILSPEKEHDAPAVVGSPLSSGRKGIKDIETHSCIMGVTLPQSLILPDVGARVRVYVFFKELLARYPIVTRVK